MKMKSLIAHSLPFASMMLLAGASFGQERVTDETVTFLYEARAEIRTSDQNLARIISVDYRNARD